MKLRSPFTPAFSLKARSFSQAASQSLLSLWRQEDGQDLVEYTLLIAGVALAATGLMSGVRMEAKGILSTMNTVLSSATVSAS
jgi:Flp pilus assembly pilin Flp